MRPGLSVCGKGIGVLFVAGVKALEKSMIKQIAENAGYAPKLRPNAP